MSYSPAARARLRAYREEKRRQRAFLKRHKHAEPLSEAELVAKKREQQLAAKRREFARLRAQLAERVVGEYWRRKTEFV